MASYIDDSPQVDILEALAKAMNLDAHGEGSAPLEDRSAAESLLRLPASLWEQATLLRAEAMGHATLAGLHPVLRAMLGMDDVVWDAITGLRPKFARATREGNETVRSFVLKATAVALTPREEVSIDPVHTRPARPRLTEAQDHEDDAASSIEGFHQNYLKHRPAALKTQADVARAAGISVGTVATIEKMNAKPHHATVVKLAHAFGVRVEDLLAPAPPSRRR